MIVPLSTAYSVAESFGQRCDLNIPFIPGIRGIPRRIPIYRLIWREHYREHEVET